MKPEEIKTKYDVDSRYDELNVAELETRLKRKPTQTEVINSDKDTELVSEVMWKLIKQLSQQVEELETKLINKGVV